MAPTIIIGCKGSLQGPGPGLLVWLVIALLTSGLNVQARYFGGFYQDQTGGGLPAMVAAAADPSYDLAEATSDSDSVIPIPGLLDTPADVPIAPESNEASPDGLVSKMFYVSNHAQEDLDWAKSAGKYLTSLGHVAGVAASADFLYIFHRCNTTWNDSSFNDETNVYNHQHEPIKGDTVMAVDLVTGEVMFSWGKNSFYLPHGISVDPQGNIWLTDVALHQAFRYKKNNFEQPDLVLGEKFVPGSDDSHFCKPTDVAISSSGVIYIADGYCNSRIVIFSANGKYLAEIGHNDKMLIPHSLTLLEIEDLICVADRENGRILCYNAGLSSYRQAGQLLFEVAHAELHKLYAIAHLGDVILALNGGSDGSIGVSLDLATEQVVDLWSPTNDTFHWAHDLTTAHDGRSFYVAQFGPLQALTATGTKQNVSKVLKFDMIESKPMFMN